MPVLRLAFCVAKKMGAGLGGRRLLLGALQKPSQATGPTKTPFLAKIYPRQDLTLQYRLSQGLPALKRRFNTAFDAPIANRR